MATHSASKTTSHDEIPFYRNERVLSITTQVVSAVVVIGLLVLGILNFFRAAEARNLSLSYHFLGEAAGFPISDPAIPYEPSMTFGRAFLVGLLNTLRVSVLGIVTATIIGTLVALARLSPNWLMSKLALAYTEFHRNIPLLVLLFLWYFAVFNKLPKVEESLRLPGPIYMNKRGIFMTWPRLTEDGTAFLISLIVGVVSAIIAYRVLQRIRERTGRETYFVGVSLGLLVIVPVIGWFLSGGTPLRLDVPTLEGFNFSGGLRITPEFAGLFVGLTMYTSGFIAEVVRAGIQAVSKGQLEAAQALGFKPGEVLRLVILPQALRIIIPPMISQYLNLTKNSSLALVVGYQDLFSVGKITINQAGRAVPVFILVMAVYLALSLLTSFTLNIYNRRIQLVTR